MLTAPHVFFIFPSIPATAVLFLVVFLRHGVLRLNV